MVAYAPEKSLYWIELIVFFKNTPPCTMGSLFFTGSNVHFPDHLTLKEKNDD